MLFYTCMSLLFIPQTIVSYSFKYRLKTQFFQTAHFSISPPFYSPDSSLPSYVDLLDLLCGSVEITGDSS